MRSKQAGLALLLAITALSSGCAESNPVRGPSAAFAVSPGVLAEGSRGCIASGMSKVVASTAMVASGLEATWRDDDLALGFASAPKRGQTRLLDLSTLATKAAASQASTSDIRRLVPIGSRLDEAGGVADTDCPSHLVRQARTVEAPEPFVVGTCSRGIAWAPSATDTPVPLWPLADPSKVEALRGIALGAGMGYAVAMRYEGAVLVGALDDAKQPTGSLMTLATRATSPGSPSLAASGGSVFVTWDDREAMKAVLWRPGTAPEAVRGVGGALSMEPGCSVACEEEVMTPSVSALSGGGFLVVYNQGTVRSHRLRAQTFDANGVSVGEPVTLSEPGTNVVGRARAVVRDDGRGAVVYFASNGRGFEAVATPILCGS